jgi:hypothetical protein
VLPLYISAVEARFALDEEAAVVDDPAMDF